MTLALALDTAAPVVGAALVEGGTLLGAWSARVSRGAEARLAPAIQELLQGRRPDVVGVSAGPGTFTGVRVGVATAVGLAQAWDVPLVTVSSLVARAALVPGHPRVLALLDARKGRFYAGLFDTRGVEPVPLGPEGDLPPDELPLEHAPMAVGEGVLPAWERLEGGGCAIAHMADQSPALALASLTGHLFRLGRAAPPELARIHYIRPPDARPPVIDRPGRDA